MLFRSFNPLSDDFVMNEPEVINDIMKKKTFTNAELFSMLSSVFPGNKTTTIYSKIDALIQQGFFYRDGRGHYRSDERKEFSYRLSPEGTKIQKVAQRYGVPFIIYEADLLNLWLNHQINSEIIFVEIERPYMEFLFDDLKNKKYSDVLLNPSAEEFYRYRKKDGYTILVKPLAKEAPKSGENIPLEKLIVDLFSDRLLRSLYEEAELPEIYRQMVHDYRLRMTRLYSYAKRKKIYESFHPYWEHSLKGESNS